MSETVNTINLNTPSPRNDKTNLIAFVVIFVFIVASLGGLVLIFGKEEKKTFACDSVSYTKDITDPVAKISTSKGCIITELYKGDAPKTVDNFVGLAEKGYYNNLKFHRVLPNFVIQTGDPKGDGTGGESIYGAKFDDELNPETESYKTGYVKGVLAMANSGENTNGSQFFITVDDVSKTLDKKYTIFGKVLVGQDVADQISQVETTTSAGGEKSVPLQDITMTKVEILK